MVMDLIIVWKEIINYMSNILTLYFMHEYSCQKHIYLRLNKSSKIFIKGIDMASKFKTNNDSQNPVFVM